MWGEHLSIQLLWATSQLLVTCVSLIYLVDEFFIFLFLMLLKEMKTHGESKISSSCFCVWCKSKELGGWGSPGLPCLNQVGKSFVRPTSNYNKLLGRVAFRILSNIHDGALLRKQPTALTRWLFPKKISKMRCKIQSYYDELFSMKVCKWNQKVK